MASLAYTRGIMRILDGTILLESTPLKLALAKATYVPSKTETDLLTFAASEADCDNYVGGFGGSSRAAVTATLAEETGNDRVTTRFSDVTYPGLGGSGGGANNNIFGYAVLIREVTSDADSIPIVAFQFFQNVTTNGEDILVKFDYDFTNSGNLRWNV